MKKIGLSQEYFSTERQLILVSNGGDQYVNVHRAVENYLPVTIKEGRVSKFRRILSWYNAGGIFSVIDKLLFNLILRFADKKKNISSESPGWSFEVNSINSDDFISILRSFKDPIVVFVGTRLFHHEYLRKVKDIDIYNLHVGITPAYRGVYGGIWAIFSQRNEEAGVTLHKVNKGIDTGQIIGQLRVDTSQNEITWRNITSLQNERCGQLLVDFLNDQEMGIIEIDRNQYFRSPGFSDLLRYYVKRTFHS